MRAKRRLTDESAVACESTSAEQGDDKRVKINVGPAAGNAECVSGDAGGVPEDHGTTKMTSEFVKWWTGLYDINEKQLAALINTHNQVSTALKQEEYTCWRQCWDGMDPILDTIGVDKDVKRILQNVYVEMWDVAQHFQNYKVFTDNFKIPDIWSRNHETQSSDHDGTGRFEERSYDYEC